MPTLETTPHKRRRVDDEENAMSLPPTRSEIWFDDGSVVLQAQNVQFRVHRSMLARHSPIFRDMFDMAQPEEGGLTVDSCPIVNLAGDSPEDLKHTLIALYDKSYNVRDALPFPVVAAMIRIGRKYEIEQLRDEGLLRLTLEFPTTLKEWEKLAPDYTHIVSEPGLLFDIVNLALEHNIRSILPAAYYLCVQNLEEILYGSKRSDGSLSQLPYEIQRLCVLGREKILLSQAQGTFAWVDGLGTQGDCLKPQTCSRVGDLLSKEIWKPMPDSSRTMEKWTDFIEDHLTLLDEICYSCVEDAKMIHEAGRQRIWNQLPKLFGLPDWNELRNFEE